MVWCEFWYTECTIISFEEWASNADGNDIEYNYLIAFEISASTFLCRAVFLDSFTNSVNTHRFSKPPVLGKHTETRFPRRKRSGTRWDFMTAKCRSNNYVPVSRGSFRGSIPFRPFNGQFDGGLFKRSRFVPWANTLCCVRQLAILFVFSFGEQGTKNIRIWKI